MPIGLVVGFIAWRRLTQVGRDLAHQLVKDGARLIDVRTPAEFGTGHLPGAINAPVADLSARAATLGAKDDVLVIYCASGTRSALARGILKRAGFTRVHDLGPMSRW